MTHSRSAFSLMELLVVLTIVAIVVAVVTVNFSRPYRLALFQQDVQAVVSFDSAIRRLASSSNRAAILLVDLNNNQLHAALGSGANRILQQYDLANGGEIETVRFASGRHHSGRIQIPINAAGGSATYAINLATDGKEIWLVFAGGSGQCLEIETEEEVDEIFEILQVEGINTG